MQIVAQHWVHVKRKFIGQPCPKSSGASRTHLRASLADLPQGRRESIRAQAPLAFEESAGLIRPTLNAASCRASALGLPVRQVDELPPAKQDVLMPARDRMSRKALALSLTGGRRSPAESGGWNLPAARCTARENSLDNA